MGYTHYWTQTRNFTADEWATISADLKAIVQYSQHERGIGIANGNGDGGTTAEFTDHAISFNGIGDDSHETFFIERTIRKPDYVGRQKGWDFCKTARKPYDATVTACLAYLATITRRSDPATGEPLIGTESHSVESDGDGSDWLLGVELARAALPRYANQLDIPMPIMESDRWCAPWIDTRGGKTYEVRFCVDGRGYVLKPRTGESYCFESHAALAQFLDRNKYAAFRSGSKDRGTWSYGKIEENIWNASGCFDDTRYARIARAQAKVLAQLFPVDPACDMKPPLYVRPGDMPPNGGRQFCYSLTDLLNLCEGKVAA